MTQGTLASVGEIGCTEFADFMAKVPYHHALAAVAGFDGQPLAAFSVHRRKDARDFGRDEAAVIDRIAPHLGRALALRRWSADPAAAAEVGLLAFGASGQLLFMNRAARTVIPPGGAVAVGAALPPAGSGCLRLGFQRYRVSRHPWCAASLLTSFAVQDADDGRPDRNGRIDGTGAGHWAEVTRLGHRLTIVSLVPWRRRDDLRGRLGHFGLSRRELEITAQSVLGGLTNTQLGHRLCISEDTVKSHLREAYRKIRVGSRIELLVKVLGLDGDPPSGPPHNGPG